MDTDNIIGLFIASAERVPDRTAFIHDEESVSYQELYEEIKRTALFYRGKGIKKGDKALVLAPMSIGLYRTVLALFYIGACPVFLDEWVSIKRLKSCCDIVPCKAIIASGKFLLLSILVKELRRIPIKINVRTSADKGTDIAVTPTPAAETALITFTTGTTGIPKAADRTHGFLQAQYLKLLPLLDNGATTSLVLLPIVVLVNLGLGKTVVLPPRKFSAKKEHTTPSIIHAITHNRVEEVIASPALLNNMCAHIQQANAGVACVQYLLTGGGPVFPQLASKLAVAFPGAKGMAVYGSTESEPISYISLEDLSALSMEDILSDGLPVGRPETGVSLAIIPFNDVPMPELNSTSFIQLQQPAGVVGEIIVTGRHVLKTYINNPEAVRRFKLDIDGVIWHRTGDAGSLSGDGSLNFWGACKEIIIYKGRAYYPIISCYVARQLTAVRQSALLLKDGQLVLVLESVKPVEQQILQIVLNKLFLDDAKVIYLDGIPTDPRHHSKIDYESLRRHLDRMPRSR